MTKRCLTFVCTVILLALFTAVIALSFSACGSDPANDTATEPAPTSAQRLMPPSDDPTDEISTEALTEEPTEDVTEAPTDAPDTDGYGYTDILCAADTYRIRRVYDHANGVEVTAREVFGKLYSYCSLSFSYDGTFELCINPNSGEMHTGTYAVYGDVISVEYDDGRGSEYRIISDSADVINYVLVNYGDYDVYFG